jgi:hypothetical protein
MSKNLTEAVLCALKPMTFYRVKDVEKETTVPEHSIRQALADLAKGGSRED